MYGFNGINPLMAQLMIHENNNRTEYELRQDINLLKNDLEKCQTQNFDPILTTIEIKETSREMKIDGGASSEIFSGIYSFIPQFSIHKNVSNAVNGQDFLRTGYLVRKKGQEKKIPASLKNEFNFLYFIRNKVCPYFAKYYCNNTIFPFSDGELYLQYYPCSLAESHLKENQKLKAMEDICMALIFLNNEGIIHRDLKELNIMIDKRKRARLIDFGSVTGISGITRFKPIDYKSNSAYI
jgi:serine/threonine protein kinase